MKHLLLIGHHDLRLFLRSKVSYVYLFAMPLVFVYFMGYANRGPGTPANPRPAVLVENLDTNFLATMLLDELGTQGMRTVGPDQAADAQRGIRIPADFTGRVLAGEQAKVEFFQRDGSPSGEGAMIELRLVRALVAINSHVVAAATAAGPQMPLTEAALRQARKVTPSVRLDARFAGRKPMPTGFNFSLPGNLVMYLMLNLLVFGGASLAAERRNGVIRRLAVHPIPRGALVGGKIYGLLLLGAVQIGVFLVAGRFGFGVNLGANLPAVAVTLMVYAWVAAALGVFVGSAVRGQDKVVGLCVLAALLMAALGGCWWPLEIAPGALKIVAHCLPSGWAMEALHQLISFGGGFAEAKEAIGVLVLFGLGATALAVKGFRS
jgi:ABC-type multidrug transport system permease subunit